jgi:activator of HSP90 ATPase
MWYHWIDKEQSEWAKKEIEDRHRRAWADFKEEDDVEEAAAKAKAGRER